MGQRLNFEFMYKNDLLANCYYHWSGFTSSSLVIANQIIEAMKVNPFKNSFNAKSNKMYVVNLLRFLGASLCIRNTTPMFPEEYTDEGVDRNNGLISVTEKDMGMTRFWEEGRVTFHLDSNSVDFNVFWHYNSEEEAVEVVENWTERDVEDIDDLEIEGIKFKDFKKFKNELDNHLERVFYYKGEYLVPIE